MCFSLFGVTHRTTPGRQDDTIQKTPLSAASLALLSIMIWIGIWIFVLLFHCSAHAFSSLKASTTIARSSGGRCLNSNIPLHMSGLFGESQPLDKLLLANGGNSNANATKNADWQIYIDQSKASLDKGGSATLDAFCGLSPPSKVRILPAILPKSYKYKSPWVRCISKRYKKSLDIANVDSVDKVYRVLTKQLQIQASDERAWCILYLFVTRSLLLTFHCASPTQYVLIYYCRMSVWTLAIA
jgi:hypothetical protein